MFPGRSTSPLFLASFRAKPSFPRNRITGRKISLNVWVGGHLSVLAPAWLAKSRPSRPARVTRYQSAVRIEFTTRCWQLYLAKAGPSSGCPLLLVSRPYAVQQQDGFSKEPERGGGDRRVKSCRGPGLAGLSTGARPAGLRLNNGHCLGGQRDAWKKTHAACNGRWSGAGWAERRAREAVRMGRPGRRI